MKTFLGVFSILAAVLVFGIILNPYFWKGFIVSFGFLKSKLNNQSCLILLNT